MGRASSLSTGHTSAPYAARGRVVLVLVAVLILGCDENGNPPLVDDCPDIAAVDSRTAAPLTGRIVFESRQSGTSQIFTIDPDGSDRIRLTHGDRSAIAPSWSPDGTEIVFAFDSLGSTAGWPLYRMAADGTNIRALKVLQTLEDGFKRLLLGDRPDWSPLGSKIAYQHCFNCEGGGVNTEIFLYDLVRDTVLTLSSYPGHDTGPRWSPNATRLLFESGRDFDRGPEFELYVMNPDGSNPTRLTFLNTISSVAAWSPDARRIAFSAMGQIRLQHLDCTESIPLDLDDVGLGLRPLDWSPDGGHLLVGSYSRESGVKASFLYIVNLSTLTVRKLVEDAETGFGDWLWPPGD